MSEPKIVLCPGDIVENVWAPLYGFVGATHGVEHWLYVGSSAMFLGWSEDRRRPLMLLSTGVVIQMPMDDRLIQKSFRKL